MNNQEQKRPVIKFYGTGGDHGSFSNFAHYPIRLHGRVWPFDNGRLFANLLGQSEK